MDSSNKLATKFRVIIMLLACVSLAGVVSTGIMWNKLENLDKDNTTALDEEEMSELVSEIGKFLTLPKDETPTLLTLTEEEIVSLNGQVFFANALAGDKLLVYRNNSKAVLWRPTTKKVIEASIINMNPEPVAPAGTSSETTN